jgi:xylan 1,4-beta-xylosidase
MLATGDGAARFKLGSTNACTEDASGKPVYDWTIIGRVPLDRILTNGVRGEADVDALAVRGQSSISVLAWNYRDDQPGAADAARRDAHLALRVARLAGAASRALVRQYRIDETRSNAWTLWKKMGSPQDPTPNNWPNWKRPASCTNWVRRAG